MPKKVVDKDRLIADLQDKVSELQQLINYQEREKKRAEDRADENYKNGRAWKESVDNAEKARKDALANERAAAERRLEAEKDLSFAEGYIAALKGIDYGPRVKLWDQGER